MIRRMASFCLSLSLLIAPLALAQESAPPSPSQEAVAACAGRESGASCVPQPPRLAPPPEALEACKGQQDGATCGITGPRGEPLAGICRSGPSGELAACVPSRPPPLNGTGGGGR